MADRKPKPKNKRAGMSLNDQTKMIRKAAQRMSKQYSDANLTAKPVKKASQGSNAAVAKAGEMQRREMARTRLKTQIKKANNPATRESAQSKAQKKAMKKGPTKIKGFTYGKDTI